MIYTKLYLRSLFHQLRKVNNYLCTMDLATQSTSPATKNPIGNANLLEVFNAKNEFAPISAIRRFSSNQWSTVIHPALSKLKFDFFRERYTQELSTPSKVRNISSMIVSTMRLIRWLLAYQISNILNEQSNVDVK